jgi:hypothetical protein
MSRQSTRLQIKALIEEINEEKRAEFRALGYRKKKRRYTKKQKDYAVSMAQEKGVRCTSKLLGLYRKTLQRWLRAQGIWVKRCPDWVYDWAYWRNWRREKWERRGY